MPSSTPSTLPTTSPILRATSPGVGSSPSLGHTNPASGPFPPVASPSAKALLSTDASQAPKTGVLALQDGGYYAGYSFGAESPIAGECVFQTGMTGYPESLTDPSYRSQILILTYPLIGNYGVPSRTLTDATTGLPVHFESDTIHIAALIVGKYDPESFSHFLADSSLSAWLREKNIPALYGIDTRALTEHIRECGVVLGKVVFPTGSTIPVPQETEDPTWLASSYSSIAYSDPNAKNLVAQVSCKETHIYSPSQDTTLLKHPSGRIIRILAVDVGMKYNQIRCFLRRGVEVKVVPWDFNFTQESEDTYDGIFLSNGPGDPVMVPETIRHIKVMLERRSKPLFGICLGHQLMALASGAKTIKMKYGNRGQNIPCTSMITGRCYITSQNHGYAVDTSSLPVTHKELFVNANDGSNEGIYHTSLPYFSVQFHPEASPGPADTEYLFDTFLSSVTDCIKAKSLVPIADFAPEKTLAPSDIPRLLPETSKEERVIGSGNRVGVRKVLVLGSGGLSIGQAGEFDYSGSQAIKALKEEGIYTILVNPNIATIQTSKGLADKVYFLPVSPEFVRKVIHHERPDGIYCTFGGQTALSVGIAMKDEFASLGVRVLGTPIETIITTEDRELFAASMASIGEKCAQSAAVTSLEEAKSAAASIGFPVIVRAAYALGGLGSGFAETEEELIDLCSKAFAASPQVLVERSMKGWKEIEYEVVRDSSDNCITVCNMENFDPLGIHTGDSIVVAPSQTLSDADYQMLRTTAIRCIRHLGVVGECNIQYALNPDSQEYCIIEVNARLSRSSALASKATGYPLAFVAAKLGLGVALNEVRNSVTRKTSACFEPSLDYMVVKIPRWDLKKFNRVSTLLSSSMKSVGEVMAIGRTFEETIQKAIRAVDDSFIGFGPNDYVVGHDSIVEELKNPSDQRVFAIANAFDAGWSVEEVWKITRIDRWFLSRLAGLITMEKTVRERYGSSASSPLPTPLLRGLKQSGFSDRQIARCIDSNEIAVREMRKEAGVIPMVRQIDTVAGEFPAQTNYLYMTYNAAQHDVSFGERGVMVLGSGVYRIGSSVEFDWCAVRAIRTLREAGRRSIMVNYNPETVSTDYDEADRLYFENISLERVLDIYEAEGAIGALLAMGGQTPNNIALPLHRRGVRVLGTRPEMIDTAENRYKFSRMLDKIEVDQPAWRELTSLEEAEEFCSRVGFPVLVRPSYVLSGAAMNVVFTRDDLSNYLSQAASVSRDHPVVISKYIEEAKEVEMDAVARDGELVMHVISEHVENAGVHSGDATLILPPQDLDGETVSKIRDATAKIAKALAVTGPFNIQFIAKDREIKVIECNLRAARSFPFTSKVSGVDMIELATKAMLGLDIQAYPGWTEGPSGFSSIPPGVQVDEEARSTGYVGVKVAQFSFSRLSGADPILGVEMASTGEVAAFGKDKYEAYLKALLATGVSLPERRVLLSIGSYKEKLELLPSVRRLHTLGFRLFATAGTADFYQEHNIPIQYLQEDGMSGKKVVKDEENTMKSIDEHLAKNLIDLYINLPSKNRFRRPASYVSRGYQTRRMAVDYAVPLITNVKCAKLYVEALARSLDLAGGKRESILPLSAVDVKSGHRTLRLPGFLDLGSIEVESEEEEEILKAGFTSRLTLNSITPGSAGWVDVVPLGGPTSRVRFLDEGKAGGSDWSFGQAQTFFKQAIQEGVQLIMASGSSSDQGWLATLLLAFSFVQMSGGGSGSSSSGTSKSRSTAPSLALHIRNIQSLDDLQLIGASKSRGLRVTCDVSIQELCRDAGKGHGMWKEHQNAVVEGDGGLIDALSVGHTAPMVSSPSSGSQYAQALHEALPLLWTNGVSEEEIQELLSVGPRRILGLDRKELGEETYVEVEVDRKVQGLVGVVHRVVVRGETRVLDGTLIGTKEEISRLVLEAKGPSSSVSLSKVEEEAASADLGQESGDEALSSAAPLTQSGGKRQAPSAVSSVGFVAPTQSVSSSSLEEMQKAVYAVAGAFRHRHILSVKQFSRDELHILFGVAQEMGRRVEAGMMTPLLQGRILNTLFYEPSTRTSCSFEAAMLRLGGSVSAVEAQTSSVTKGESLPDTVRTLGCYGDALVIRHPDPGSALLAAKYSSVPVFNAGDGVGEHPTQAFLDAFTIREELGTVNGLTITMVGDLLNGRTVHSLVRLLTMYHVTLNFIAPPGLEMPEEVLEELQKSGTPYAQYSSLEADRVVEATDVLYVTRVQKERFEDPAEYARLKDTFCVDNSLLTRAKSHMIVMHPLPRVHEIAPEVDFDQRAAYFRQMRYGLYVRMALLALVMGSGDERA